MTTLAKTTKAGLPTNVLQKIREAVPFANVFIRTTNPGVVHGVQHQYVVGKPLKCKPKSSSAPLLESRLALCPFLHKKFVTNSTTVNYVALEIAKILGYQAELLQGEFKTTAFQAVPAYIIGQLEKGDNNYRLWVPDDAAKNRKRLYKAGQQTVLLRKETATHHNKTVDCYTTTQALNTNVTKTQHVPTANYALHEVANEGYPRQAIHNACKALGGNWKVYQVLISFTNNAFNPQGNNWPKYVVDVGHITTAATTHSKDSVNLKMPYRIDKKEVLVTTTTTYYPVKVLAEEGAWCKDSKLRYYPLVADYDLFAVTPLPEFVKYLENPASIKNLNSSKLKDTFKEAEKALASLIKTKNHLDYFKVGYKPVSSHTWLNKYDATIKGIDDSTHAYRHLGLISAFENYVRMKINVAVGIPMARHGCEVNNLLYTSAIKDIEQVLVTSRYMKRVSQKSSYSKISPKENYTCYNLRNVYFHTTNQDYLLTLNPTWFNPAGSILPPNFVLNNDLDEDNQVPALANNFLLSQLEGASNLNSLVYLYHHDYLVALKQGVSAYMRIENNADDTQINSLGAVLVLNGLIGILRHRAEAARKQRAKYLKKK